MSLPTASDALRRGLALLFALGTIDALACSHAGSGPSATSDAGGRSGGSAGSTGASDAASEVVADGPAPRACAETDAGAPGGFHVNPTGKPSGDGSALAPWDLATALAQPAAVHPGATLWLHGGVYKGTFTSALAGEMANPITVRGAPGEHAVLDGVDAPNAQVLTINGAYSIFRDFEVTNSFATRVIMSTGSNPPDARGSGVGMYGKGVKLIDLVIHDTGVGVGNWSPAPDGEVYGCIIFYNGWDAPDRGHGHGIYAQNETGMKLLTDNVIFRQFSYGIHGYTEGGKIDNFDVEGNIVFNNGELSQKSGFATDILVGGLQIAQTPRLHQNVTYFPKGEGSNNVGYSAGCTTATVTENYFVAATALEMVKCVGMVERNTFVGAVAGFDSVGYPSNGYPMQISGTAVRIRPNKYDPARAHLAIFNWDKLDAVDVDVSGVLSPGDAYQLLDVQDLFGPPVLSGVYTAGKLAVPMTSTGVTTPVGNVPVSVTHTSREFGAFLIRKACPGAP
jgi:Right handed beta helix region